MKRLRASILAVLTAGSLGLVFSACSGTPGPEDGSGGAGGSGGSADGSGGAQDGSGGGSGGSVPTTGGAGGIGGLGGLGGLGGMGGADCGCDEAWSLECYCAEFACPTFEEATEDPFCPISSPLGEAEVVTGCGRVTVVLPLGQSIRTYVYAEDDHELISAAYIDDTNHGSCDTFAYSGGIEDVEACGDESTEPLCP